jgi:hypothetical protein
MRRSIGCLVLGVILEFMVLLSAIPSDSTQPMTAWQKTAANLLLPERAVVGATNFVLERLPPGPFLTGSALLGLGAALLAQAVSFALPLWLALTAIQATRKPRTVPI